MRLFNPTRSTAVSALLILPNAFAQGSSASANATSTAGLVQPTTVTLTTSVASYEATSSGSSLIAASTAVPEPTAALNSTVSYAPLPPAQDWCPGGPNSSYCPGALLQLVQLAGLFADSKVFPDKPTNGTADGTAQAFAQLPQNATVGEVETFVENNFRGEGLEIVPVTIEGFNATPAVLSEVEDPFLKGFVSIVNGYWALLIRETNSSALCTEDVCDSSLIPLNNTIVVPGGRYREVYYWDSFWILEGLLKSELYEYAGDLLTNFMDLLDLYGFLPNGGRKYYLNRSQPPVFVQMVNSYILVTGNTTILERALPLMETELEWWRTNRTFSLTSPFTGRNHSVAIFNVTNSAPRPEGYVEDYETAFGATPPLNETQRSALYAELATGAESGWDYSSRWCKEPLLNVSDNYPALRTLNGRAIVPVDLNALLYGDHVLLANLYETYLNGSSGNDTSSVNATGRIAQHRMIASEFESAILDLFWDPAKSYFYDFNTTANDRADIFHAGGLFPLWQNITPSEIVNNETAALNVFQGIRYIAGKYPGSPSVATLLETGLNWDAPNVWPPHTYTSIKALETIGRLYPNGTVLESVISTNFSSIPVNQLGLNETDLPEQPQDAIGPNSPVFARSVAEVQQGLPWWKAIAVEYANRYMLSAFCSWYSTGGAIPGVLNPLSSGTLNATGANPTDTGHIFEKFNATDVDAAGGGGEYEVVIGFGWTNGVILHTAGEYGQYLVSPACPLIVLVDGIGANSTGTNGTAGLGKAGVKQGEKGPAQGYRIPPLYS